jgi:hypothetical protein
MLMTYLLLASTGLSGITDSTAPSPASACQSPANLLDCVAQIDVTETVPSQAAPVRRYTMRNFARKEQQQRQVDGMQATDLLVLRNGLILQAIEQSPARPCLPMALLSMGDGYVDTLGLVSGALEEKARFPTPDEPLDAEYQGYWDYGRQTYRVKVEAISTTRFHFDIVKTAITSPNGTPVSAPSGDHAACGGPRITSDDAALDIKNGKHVEACRIMWDQAYGTTDQAASLAKLPPVGQHLSGFFDLEALPLLPDDTSLTMWRTEDGKQYRTAGEARQQHVDGERSLKACKSK